MQHPNTHHIYTYLSIIQWLNHGGCWTNTHHTPTTLIFFGSKPDLSIKYLLKGLSCLLKKSKLKLSGMWCSLSSFEMKTIGCHWKKIVVGVWWVCGGCHANTHHDYQPYYQYDKSENGGCCPFSDGDADAYAICHFLTAHKRIGVYIYVQSE